MFESGKFYFIKDVYFDLFKEYNLMQNKENGNKRPCYFCFKDFEIKRSDCIKEKGNLYC